MKEIFGFDAFSPAQIAERVESVGMAKARLPVLSVIMLGILAGVFIGFGAMLFTLVTSDTTLSFAVSRLLGGLVFSLGLILVVVAGAELFTGNNLIVMAWADGRIEAMEVMRNWVIVGLSNFAGALLLVVLIINSGHLSMYNGVIARKYLDIASAKCSLPVSNAFFSGILCNMLVCLAIWMSFAGRTIIDRAVAIIFPITAFVALGFEHSIANMYFLMMGLLIEDGSHPAITLMGAASNLVYVIAGNIVGGSVFVGVTYFVIYRRGKKDI